jgi:hypothetical protein
LSIKVGASLEAATDVLGIPKGRQHHALRIRTVRLDVGDQVHTVDVGQAQIDEIDIGLVIRNQRHGLRLVARGTRQGAMHRSEDQVGDVLADERIVFNDGNGYGHR